MKRRIVILVVLVALALGLAADTSSYYPVRLDVVKIYSHADGYRLVYRQGPINLADVYVPITWFVPGGKAEIVFGHDTAYPYAMVFYKDGVFDHIRIYASSDRTDSSWGVLDSQAGKGKFADIKDLQIKF
ncbi:MAG TPA: hypothetical protein VMV83_13790 [Rectinemataceae bacterium]|nr:hypothetical protein [Rectinemataceae bacterium]